MLAVTSRGAGEPPCELVRAVDRAGLPPLRRVEDVWLTSWGHEPTLPTGERPLLLSGPARRDGAVVDESHVARLLADGDVAELGRFLPPFGAVGVTEGGVRIAIDRMGLRQVFWCRGPGWDAASTSARLLGRLLGRGWDEEGVLVQSQVGWQLGQRTLYLGVTKLAPDESLLLSRDDLSVATDEVAPGRPGATGLEDAVDHAAAILRQAMSHYLDDASDPLLQLTGGMDSRLVLSSVPADRRHAMRAMTLDVPGSADAMVARAIADRCGLHHRVLSLDGLGSVPPAEWFERVRTAAQAHDAMVDPVAKAATEWAEESMDQGHRLGGVGGEIGRGFYYTGRVRPLAVTRRRSDRLAQWKVLANEAVEPDALHERHRQAARTLAQDAVHAALVAAGDDWFGAADDLYYRHRMTRWAGPPESVASTRRQLMNPLLHPAYVEVVRALSPRDKSHGQFVGRLQMALDPELGRIAMEGRPSPAVFASPGLAGRTRQGVAQARRAARKAVQRARGGRRPSAGGAVVASGILRHVRANTGVVEPLRDSGWFDPEWLTQVLDGTVQPQPNTVAFMMNVLVGLDPGGRTHDASP